ncbi:MAG: 30S ribosomal protein S15 [Brevinematales bacterium]
MYLSLFFMLLPEDKKVIVEEFGRHPKDVGSPEVQIAILTKRIKILEEHLKVHKNDFAVKRSLSRMISRRKKLLEYLFKEDPERYGFVVQKLNLRSK